MTAVDCSLDAHSNVDTHGLQPSNGSTVVRPGATVSASHHRQILSRRRAVPAEVNPTARDERRRSFEAETLPHLARVHAAARRFAGPEASEDLTQETYLRAYRTFDNFEPGTNALAWLLTILRSIYLNRQRRGVREPEVQEPQTLETTAARSMATIDWEASELARATAGRWGAGEVVGEALDRLPEDFRTVVLLVDLHELSYEEAAEALDCPVGTVRSRLARARRRLAAELAEYARHQGLEATRRIQ